MILRQRSRGRSLQRISGVVFIILSLCCAALGLACLGELVEAIRPQDALIVPILVAGMAELVDGVQPDEAVMVPILLAVAFGVSGFLLLRARRVERFYFHAPPDPKTRHCTACGYLLCGLAESRCPECGQPFPRCSKCSEILDECTGGLCPDCDSPFLGPLSLGRPVVIRPLSQDSSVKSLEAGGKE